MAKGKDLKIVNLVIDQSLTLKADPQILKRILVNLMTNAIKFTEKGVISLDCQTRLGEALEFSVKDTGIGLLDEEKNIIFERFRQVDYSSKRRYEGIGLGLSIVKELVESHKGSVRVESVYKEGSTFLFTIPLNLEH